MHKVELVQCLSGHVGRVWNVSWHPQGTTLASCGEDKTIRIWGQEAEDKWVNRTILTEGHQRTIREVAWSPCGNLLASASFDATTSIWDRKTGQFECNVTLEGHDNEVKSVAWSKSGDHLATCSRDKSVWVWEVIDEEFECAGVLSAHTQDVKKVIWHPHLDIVASASYDNTIKLFKEDPTDNDWICLQTLTGHDSTVWSIAFDSTGTRLISCSADKTLKVWKEYLPGNTLGIETPDDGPVWKCVCTLSGYHTRPIYDISWCHTTNLIATACGDDIIRIFKEKPDSNPDEPSFELLYSQSNAHSQDVNGIAWNPAIPGLLASCSDDGSVKIWQFTESM